MIPDVESDLELLRRHHADHADHSGGTLLTHLTGTAALLRSWGAPAHVCRAGLFHSIYGTEAFQDAAVAPIERDVVVAQIGVEAEALAHLFARVTRDSLHDNAGRDGDFFAHCRLSNARLELTEQQLDELLLLATANWIEQRRRLEPALARARCAQYRRILPHLPPLARAALRRELAELLDTPAPDADPTSLCDLFAFDEPLLLESCCARLDVRYLGAVSARLRRQLDEPTQARLDALEDDAYLTILRAPATCVRLFHDGSDLAEYLDAALQVEEWRTGTRARLDRAAWSAAGDLYLPAGTDTPPQLLIAELAARDDDFAPDRPYRAPLLAGGVVADLCSPEVQRSLQQIVYKSVPFGPAEEMSAQERATVLAKLATALAGIARVNPVTARFLRYTLTTIIPRKQSQPHLYPSSFKGSSTAATIHRANIYNLHFANVDAARLAQSIIHETVHNHLYKREYFTPTLIDDRAGEAARVTSPWSGNTLDLYVFVHSATVYYALYHFFQSCLRVPEAESQLPRATAQWFRDRAVRGFASPQWTAIVEEHQELFAPAILRDLWAMRERVLATERTNDLEPLERARMAASAPRTTAVTAEAS